MRLVEKLQSDIRILEQRQQAMSSDASIFVNHIPELKVIHEKIQEKQADLAKLLEGIQMVHARGIKDKEVTVN